MRQYGAIAGNDYDSEREFKAEKARAIENRFGDQVAEEQLEAEEPSFWDVHEDGGDWTLDYWYDWMLDVGVDNRPLTVTLVEALR